MGVDYFICDFCGDFYHEDYDTNYGNNQLCDAGCMVGNDINDMWAWCNVCCNKDNDIPLDRLKYLQDISKKYFDRCAQWCGCDGCGYIKISISEYEKLMDSSKNDEPNCDN